jgi:hypothetical protein
MFYKLFGLALACGLMLTTVHYWPFTGYSYADSALCKVTSIQGVQMDAGADYFYVSKRKGVYVFKIKDGETAQFMVVPEDNVQRIVMDEPQIKSGVASRFWVGND